MFKYESQVIKDFYKVKLTKIFTLISIINIAFSLSMPYLNSYFIDSLVEGLNLASSLKLAIILVGIGILTIILSFYENVFTVYSSNLVANAFRDRIIDRILESKISDIEKLPSGYLSHRVYTDVNSLVSFVIKNFIVFFTNVIRIIVIINIIRKIDIILLIPIFILLSLNVIIYDILKDSMYVHAKERQEKESEYFQYIQEQLDSIEYIHIYSWYCVVKKIRNKKFDEYFKELLKYSRISYVYGSLSGVLNVIFQSFMFVYGAYKINNGTMSVGQFIMINTYFVMILSIAQYYIQFIQDYQVVKISKDRINELFEMEKKKNGKKNLIDIESIKLRNIAYSYENNFIFENINIDFFKNKIYVIIGKNGSGKTTLFKIISGLIDDYVGDISMNDVDLNLINMSQTRKRNSNLVNQKLFRTHMNVEMFLKEYFNISKCEVERFSSKFPNIAGNTLKVFHKSCTELSGGELKKIYLLDVLLNPKDLIVLDEPTNDLDNFSKFEFCDALKSLSKKSIVILITHDKDIMKIADYIINMDELNRS